MLVDRETDEKDVWEAWCLVPMVQCILAWDEARESLLGVHNRRTAVHHLWEVEESRESGGIGEIDRHRNLR